MVKMHGRKNRGDHDNYRQASENGVAHARPQIQQNFCV